MTDASYAAMIRNLSKDYYQGHIGFEEYRAQRKIILGKIDEEINGHKPGDAQEDGSENSSIFMSTIAFFKGDDVDV